MTKRMLPLALAAFLVACERVTPPLGTDINETQDLIVLNLVKFQLSSGAWRCLVDQGDFVRWTGGSPGVEGYAYTAGGISDSLTDNDHIPADASGSAIHYVDHSSYGSTFQFSTGGGSTNAYTVRLDSVVGQRSYYSLDGTSFLLGADNTGGLRYAAYNSSPVCVL